MVVVVVLRRIVLCVLCCVLGGISEFRSWMQNRRDLYPRLSAADICLAVAACWLRFDDLRLL